MGDFFSKFKKSLDKSVNTVSIKSNTIVEINRIKFNITTLKNTIQTKKIEMANNFYTMYLEEAIDVEKCTVICEEIKSIEKEIRAREIEIEDIKVKEGNLLAEANKREEVQKHSVITPNRAPEGEELLDEKTVEVIDEGLVGNEQFIKEEAVTSIEEVSIKICECGAVIQEDMKFCIQCGKKIEW